MRLNRLETITLDQVDEAFVGGLPLVSHSTRPKPVGIAEFYAATIDREAELLIRATFSSMRGNVDTPQTLLHTLILRDDRTLGQIAASLHADPRTLHHELGVLTESGVVATTYPDSGLPRFSLAPV